MYRGAWRSVAERSSSRACRSEHAAGSSCVIRSRSTPNTTSRSRRQVAARGWAELHPAGGGRGEGPYIAIDGVRLSGAGTRRHAHPRIGLGLTPSPPRPLSDNRMAGADGIFDIAARAPGVSQIAIAGPHNATGPGDTPSRRRLFVCTPASAADEEPCARRILSTLLTRASRRPVAATAPELRTPLEFYRTGQRTGTFERRHPASACARACRPVLSVPVRARASLRRRRRRLPHQRSRTGVAPFVLPVEQHPGRRLDRGGCKGRAQGPGDAGAERQVRRMLLVRVPTPSSPTPPGNGCFCAS